MAFISQLPIEANDDAVLVFMSKQKHTDSRGTVYPQDLYAPVFLPLVGSYDDYGRIENVEKTKIVKFIEDFFGDNIDSVISKIDDNSVGRGDVFISTKNNDVFQTLTFGLEHKSVYDKLALEFLPTDDIKSLLIRSSRSNDIRPDGRGFSDIGWAKYLSFERGIKYVDPIDVFVENIGENDIKSFLSFNDSMMAMNSKYFPSNYGSQSQDHVLHYKMLTLYRNIIVKKLGTYDESEHILEQLKSEIRDEKLTDILRSGN